MKFIIYNIFALIENTLIIMYLNLFLKKKKKYKNNIILDISMIIILSLLLIILNSCLKISNNGIMLLVILLIYSYYVYEGNLLNKILTIVLINLNIILISGLCMFVLSTQPIDQIVYNKNDVFYNASLFIKVIWLIEYMYLKKYYTGEFKLSKKVWGFIIVVLLMLIGLIVIVTNELLYGDITIKTALYAYIVSLLVVVLIYYVCLKMTEYYNKLLDQKIRLESLKYEETIIKVANQKSEEYNKILHDYKNLIGFLKDIKINEEVKKDILAHIDLKNQRELIHTNNAVFNYALNNAMAKADEMGIDFHGTYPSVIAEGISSYDLLSLLSNLFDNAIEASQKADIKEIVYKIECNEYNFIVRVKNTYEESCFNNFETTKNDKNKHGLGLNIIKEIVDKYHGEDVVKQKDHMVLHSCLLNLKDNVRKIQ